MSTITSLTKPISDPYQRSLSEKPIRESYQSLNRRGHYILLISPYIMPYFVYQTTTHIQIENKPIRNIGELLTTFHDIVVCRNWVKKTYPRKRIKDNVSAFWVGRPRRLTPRHKRAISLSKRGKLNPLWGKHHSSETKEKIRRKKLGKYDGVNNPNYGKKHTARSRLKMSIAVKKYHRKNKKYRCTDLRGRGRYLTTPLPMGWSLGWNPNRRHNTVSEPSTFE